MRQQKQEEEEKKMSEEIVQNIKHRTVWVSKSTNIISALSTFPNKRKTFSPILWAALSTIPLKTKRMESYRAKYTNTDVNNSIDIWCNRV